MNDTAFTCKRHENYIVTETETFLLMHFYCAFLSLTSLFYGEQNEKEKSPSETSPSDSETKDMVRGYTHTHTGHTSKQ